MIARRVRYREGQTLGVADLRAEQDHLLTLARRHDLSLHEWGIVRGLSVDVDALGIRVDRGLAIDGFGRELILRAPLLIAWTTSVGSAVRGYGVWSGGATSSEKQGGIAVWLQYRLSADREADGPSSCGVGRHARWDEDPRLMFTPWAPSDPRTPPPDVDPDVPAWMRAAGSDGEQPAWPVLLAWLTRSGANEYQLDRTQRLPYVRLVANSVESSSMTSPAESPDNPSPVPPPTVATTRIDLTRNMGSPRHVFAVRTAHRAGVDGDRLRIDGAGQMTVSGTLRASAAPGQERGGVSIADAEFAPEDIKDPNGLICFLRAPARAGGITEVLKASLEESLGAWLEKLESLSQRERRVRLAAALNGLATYRTRGARRRAKKLAKSVFDRGQLAGLVLRKDTWTAIDAVESGVATRVGQMTLLVLADLLSSYVDVPQALREGAFSLALRPAPPPEAAREWTVYRTDVAKDGTVSRQMRIEIANPVANTGHERNLVAIGRFAAATSAFDACITVDAAGTVTIPGDLAVTGRIVEAPVEPDPNDPRFVEEIVNAWTSGTVGGLEAASTIAIDLTDLKEAATGTKWPYTAKLKNNGTGPVADVNVFEGLGINEQIVPPRPIASFDVIGAGETKDIAVTHDTLTAATGKVSVAIGVVGRGSSLGLMVAAELKTVDIIASPIS